MTFALTSPVMKNSGKIRHDWVAASEFHDLADEAVLERVLKEAVACEGSVILLDLDSTLYEVAPRTFKILQEWGATPEAAQFAQVKRALASLDLSHIGYSLRDTLAATGLNLASAETKAAFSLAKPFWHDRFFSSTYLKHDRAYPGAVDFVKALHATGAQLVYLTGRDEPGMGSGTREILERDGFPLDSKQVRFFLKPQREGDDHIHKVNAIVELKGRAPVLASFENEPKNVVAMYRAAPEAMHIFVHTVSSDHPAEPGRGLYRVKGFDRFRAAKK